jgi:hypothetical protein
MAAGVGLTIACIQSVGHPDAIEYGIVLPAILSFVAILSGLYLWMADPKPPKKSDASN